MIRIKRKINRDIEDISRLRRAYSISELLENLKGNKIFFTTNKKTMKKTLTLFTTALLAVQLISCKGPEGEPGPAGAPGKDASSNTFTGTKSGFIKGNIQGTASDGQNYSLFLDFQGVYGPEDGTYHKSDEKIEVTVNRYYAGDLGNFLRGYMLLSFTMDSLTSTKPVTPVFADISFLRDLGGGRILNISREENAVKTSTSPTVADTMVRVTNVTYNKATGEISGNYKLAFPSESGSGSLYIDNGTFSSKLSRVSFRVGAE